MANAPSSHYYSASSQLGDMKYFMFLEKPEIYISIWISYFLILLVLQVKQNIPGFSLRGLLVQVTFHHVKRNYSECRGEEGALVKHPRIENRPAESTKAFLPFRNPPRPSEDNELLRCPEVSPEAQKRITYQITGQTLKGMIISFR